MAQTLRRRMACPACRSPAEFDWMVCPDCGASLRPGAPKARTFQTGNALDSADTGEVAFVPLSGGAKRPITVVTPTDAPLGAPTVSLSELVVHARAGEAAPPAPPTEDSVRQITVPSVAPQEEAVAPPGAAEGLPLPKAPEAPAPQVPAAPVAAAVQEAVQAAVQAAVEDAVQGAAPAAEAAAAPAAPVVGPRAAHAIAHAVDLKPTLEAEPEIEPATEFVVEIAPETRAQRAETLASSPTLPSTVVVVSPERSVTSRLTSEDLSAIERIVDVAVMRALREQARMRPVQKAQTAVEAAPTQASNHRVAAVGAGLLLGGAISDALVLNWDVWVRGEAATVVGWIQQLGVIGTAALAGAGAAAFVIGAMRGRKRHARRRRALPRAQTPG